MNLLVFANESSGDKLFLPVGKADACLNVQLHQIGTKLKIMVFVSEVFGCLPQAVGVLKGRPTRIGQKEKLGRASAEFQSVDGGGSTGSGGSSALRVGAGCELSRKRDEALDKLE